MDQNTRRICDFLWFGFCPSIPLAEHRFNELADLEADSSVPVFGPGDSASAKALLVEIVAELIGDAESIVVPTSAGYDSRALLGAALEVVPRERINSFTFGHQGADDFDRARGLVKDKVARHDRVDVTAQSSGGWNTEQLVNAVSVRPHGAIFSVGELGGQALRPTDTHNTVKSTVSETPEANAPAPAPTLRLNGFLGDSLSGKKLPTPLSSSWHEALKSFVNRNKAYKGAIELTPLSYKPEESLPDQPFHGSARITFDDQLDWCFRQEQRIRFHVGAGRGPLARSTTTVHPFDDVRWWRSWILTETKDRIGQKFYKEMLAEGFPEIFPDLVAPPHAAQDGWWAKVPKLGSRVMRRFSRARHSTAKKMHVNMDYMLEANQDFRRFCVDNIQDLAARDAVPWLDLKALLQRAGRDPMALGRPLFALASLEVNFKAGHFEDVLGSPSDTPRLGLQG